MVKMELYSILNLFKLRNKKKLIFYYQNTQRVVFPYLSFQQVWHARYSVATEPSL